MGSGTRKAFLRNLTFEQRLERQVEANQQRAPRVKLKWFQASEQKAEKVDFSVSAVNV